MNKLAVGHVSYEVTTQCPHCEIRLNLSQFPYDDEGTDYCLEEDELGLAVFGTKTAPATWEKTGIEYICCHCKNKFVLDSLEI